MFWLFTDVGFQPVASWQLVIQRELSHVTEPTCELDHARMGQTEGYRSACRDGFEARTRR
ncbi:hypothetical protein BURKHO8Y_110464 [Burkholderia sp. 8Y]|nr:hypothetical protein BURKHO8Y_110464 [Burkholderia sp. 8Y]